MLGNSFGVPNGASLYIYDSSNTFQTITTSCGANPEYTTYCFSPTYQVDGDYVIIAIHGYMMTYVNDVSICVYIVGLYGIIC